VSVGVENKEVLRVDGLGKRYGDAWALRDCTFELRPGQATALVGANGSGKTTLLAVLSGLLAPDAGKLEVSGRVAFVAQDKPLYERFTATEMLKLARHLNLEWDSGRAENWLKRFRVNPNVHCGRLSGGQRTQVALAMAIGARPDLLLLDEPLANLDPLVRKEVTAELLTVAADTGMSLVLSTHIVAEIVGVADNLLLLGKGKLLLDGEIDDLLATHWHFVGPESRSMVRMSGEPQPPEGVVAEPATIEDIVLAHLTRDRDGGKA
jgi:ABC-2 type transport system ATP-binding protein